jgi:diguanylate cyclase (GGDEF)-like protein
MNPTTSTIHKRFSIQAPDRRSIQRLELPLLSSARKIHLTIGCLFFVGAIALLDYGTGPYLSFGAFYLIPVAACAWWGGLPHGLLLTVATTLAWCFVDGVENVSMPPAAGVWNGIVRFCTLAWVTSLLCRLHASMGREHRLARTDPLTGAANGRHFYETTAEEGERNRLAATPLTLAYFDLDDFKHVNDRLGHATGDEVLRLFTSTIHLQLREEGLLARLGGDEFALLLPAAAPDKAAEIIDRLHQKLSHEMSGRGWPVTVSIGSVTFLRPTADVDRMIQYADKLMYSAKKKGKRRVEYNVVSTDLSDSDGPAPGIERRATARIVCHQTTACVKLAEYEEQLEELAVVHDISSVGIGVQLRQRHSLGTLFIIEPLSCRGKTVLARVMRVSEEKNKWLHGCVMAMRLSDEELVAWTTSKDAGPSSSSQKVRSLAKCGQESLADR